MQDDVPKVNQQPAILRGAFNSAFQMILFSNAFNCCVCQRADHTVAGAGADDKVIRKIRDRVNIQQEDIFSLFIFKCVDNTSCEF